MRIVFHYEKMRKPGSLKVIVEVAHGLSLQRFKMNDGKIFRGCHDIANRQRSVHFPTANRSGRLPRDPAVNIDCGYQPEHGLRRVFFIGGGYEQAIDAEPLHAFPGGVNRQVGPDRERRVPAEIGYDGPRGGVWGVNWCAELSHGSYDSLGTLDHRQSRVKTACGEIAGTTGIHAMSNLDQGSNRQIARLSHHE